MYCFVTSLFFVGLLFCLVKDNISAATEGSFQPHCLQMSRGRKVKEINDFLPIKMNDSQIPEPTQESELMSLEICPNKTTLKFSWTIKRNQGRDLKLCYMMKAIFNGQRLLVKCVKLIVQFTRRQSSMMCWFPMEHLSQRPIISAYASPLDGRQTQDFFGELNTNALDDSDSCRHACDATVIHIGKAVIECHYKSYVEFDTKVSVKGLHLNHDDSAACMKTSVQLATMESNRLEFEVNCTITGVINISIFYQIKGFICHKYYPVRIICDSASTTVFSADALSDSSSFSFATLGTVLFSLLVIAAAVIIYCGLKRSKKPQGNRNNSYDMQMSRNGHADMRLIFNNSSLTEGNTIAGSKEECILEMTTKV